MKNLTNNVIDPNAQSPYYTIEDCIPEVSNIQYLTCIFYALNGMYAIISAEPLRFVHSAAKLKAEVEEYLNYVSGIFAQMIRDYTILACYGELRYVTEKLEDSPFHFSHYKFDANLPRGCYCSYVQDGLEYSTKSIAECCEFLYGGLFWDESFGGPAWYEISRAIKMYETYPTTVFVDHCVDLQHNTGYFINKGCGIFVRDISELECILDCKKEWDILCFIKRFKNYLDERTLRFCVRLCHLLEGYMPYIKTLPIDYDTYVTVLWGNTYDLSVFIENAESALRNEEKLKRANMEILKLSKYQPRKFGEKNLAQDIKVRKPWCRNACGVIEDEIQFSLYDYFFKPSDYPMFKNYTDKNLSSLHKSKSNQERWHRF